MMAEQEKAIRANRWKRRVAWQKGFSAIKS